MTTGEQDDTKGTDAMPVGIASTDQLGAVSEARVPVAGDWRPVRDALEYAYTMLGRQKTAEGYPTPDWNLAVHVHQFARDHEATCAHCRKPLHWSEAFRCFDCKAPLCEDCAPEHFGPNHATRARAAHSA